MVAAEQGEGSEKAEKLKNRKAEKLKSGNPEKRAI